MEKNIKIICVFTIITIILLGLIFRSNFFKIDGNITFSSSEIEKIADIKYTQTEKVTSLPNKFMPVPIDSIYKEMIVDDIYYHNKTIVGFKFQIESSFFGIAKCIYSKDKQLNEIIFYNLLKNDLKSTAPTKFILKIFKTDNSFTIYDGYSERLFYKDKANFRIFD